MANALAQRLRRLEAIRKFAEQMINRPQLGRDVFRRGQPEPIAKIKRPQWSATLYDLLSAYAGRRQSGEIRCARAQTHGLVARRGARGARTAGRPLDGLEPARPIPHRVSGRSVAAGDGVASSFAAVLELVREGQFEVHQQGSFTPLYLRKRQSQNGNPSEEKAAKGFGTDLGIGKRGARTNGEVAEMRVIVGDKDDEERRRAPRNCILEALLFAAEAPLDEKTLDAAARRRRLRALLSQLQREYAPRGVNLVRVGGKWTLRTANDLAWLLTHELVVTRKLSRAAVEMLAIVAYH